MKYALLVIGVLLSLNTAQAADLEVQVQQIINIGYSSDITRVLIERRYFERDGNNLKPIACEVIYYKNDDKNISQLAYDKNLTVTDVLVDIGSREDVTQIYGGEVNENDSWAYQNSFKKNLDKCSQSIENSGLMASVREGRGSIIYREASEIAKEELNNL